MGKNYCYYTPIELATQLLQLLPKEISISSVADICCGTCNFLKAANAQLPNASYVGVDIESIPPEIFMNNSHFFVKDGRDFANDMEKEGVCFDLLLSNPPFGRIPNAQKKYYENNNSICNCKRYETELLLANAKVVKEDGYLLIILPVSYATGTVYKKHRIWIATNFEVLNIVFLPPDTFGSNIINTVALILKKTNVQKCCETSLLIAHKVNQTWSLSKENTITHSCIASGEWFSKATIQRADIQIFRGSISSHYFKKRGVPILHCSSTWKHETWEPAIRRCAGIKASQEKFAESGDVVINRIGKDSASWCVYKGDTCLVSDCIIVVKRPNDDIVKQFYQNSVGGRLQVPRLGTATPFVSIKDIVSLINKGR